MASTYTDDAAILTALSNLEDPLRRRLYQYIAEHEGSVSREQAADAAGIGRTLAAYHLDKLADAGLLNISYQRPDGRGGPGAGRPAKMYSPTTTEMSFGVPPRDYELLARLLVSAVENDATGAIRVAIDSAARDAGRSAADSTHGDLMSALRECGFLPHIADDGLIRLRNCPFHAVARDHQDIVCGLNLRLIEGVVDGSSCRDAHPELSPRPGRCCVVLRSSGYVRNDDTDDGDTEEGLVE